MNVSREITELKQYFAIKSDLAIAAKNINPVDIEYHLTELSIMQMHTTSDRLRRACRGTISGFVQPVAAIQA